MRPLKKRKAPPHPPDNPGRKRTLLKVCAAAFAAGAAFFLLTKDEGERKTNQPPRAASRVQETAEEPEAPLRTGKRSRVRVPKESNRRLLAELAKAMQDNLFFRIQSEFTYQNLNCGFIPASDATRLDRLPTHSDFDSDPLMLGVQNLAEKHDVEMVLSIINHLDSLNFLGLAHFHSEQHEAAYENGIVPEPECVLRVLRAKMLLIRAQLTLERLILDGFAELEAVLPQLSERQRSVMLKSIAGKFFFTYMAKPNPDFDTFERHYLSLPDSDRRGMEGEMVGMAHYMEAEDAERLGSMPQEDFDALSLETQRLLILMLRAYEIRVLAEIDPDNARIIYGEGTHQ